ncbi:DUF5979 domain-containing protein [Lachnospiraceae bacterium 54-53]
MKRKKHRRTLSWLMAVMLIFNVFLPVSSIRADETKASDDVITVTISGDKASPSEADEQGTSDHAEETGESGSKGKDTEVSIATPSNGMKAPAATPLLPELLHPKAQVPGINVADLLLDLKMKITQDGNDDVDGGIIAGKDFRVEGSFRVPVEGDGLPPYECVVTGDEAEFNLDTNIDIIIPVSMQLDLTYEGEHVGTLYFESGKIRIVFDGEVLSEDGVGNVVCEFGATMKYTGTDIEEGSPNENVYIIDKEYTVKAPEVPVTQTQVKTGELSADKTKINWKVVVNAAKGSTDVSLKDYVFQDNLENAGTYVPGSFKIGENGVSDENVYDAVENTLSYTFDTDDTGEQTITFSTEVPADTLIKGGTIRNTAQFGKDGTLENTNQVTIPIAKKTLIEKTGSAGGGMSGGTYDPTNRTITWTITVNQDKIPLENVTVEDELPGNLIWKSAEWSWDNPDETDSGITLPIAIGTEPTDNKYNLNGTITKTVKLTITSEVPAESYVGTTTYYNNKAALTWDGMPNGTWSDETGDIGIGIDGLTKQTVGTPDYEKRQIQWKGTVDLKNQTGFTDVNKIKVYDLLIYGDSVKLEDTNLSTLIGAGYTKLKAKFGQRFVPGSFIGAGLAQEVIQEVTAGGVTVGQLLVVSGFNIDKAYDFTFKTQILDPNIFAANERRTVYNTASLYYDGTHLDNGDAQISYNSDILSKQVLEAGTNTVGTSANGFDPEDKTAVFRLNINAEGYDLTGAQTENGTLGNVIVKDTLPDDWTFVDLLSDTRYQLYDESNNLVTDTSDILDGDPDISGRTAEFVFKYLNKAYYILVKAQLSEEGYLKYLQNAYSNGKSESHQNAANTVKITAESDAGWETEESETVQVPTVFLVKTVNSGKNPVEWTIKFNPYDLQALKNVKITDQIPEGLEFSLKQDGSLDLTSFKVTEYDSMVSGAFPTSGGTDLDEQQLQSMISYEKASRILTFTPAEGKLYQIVYQTEVTGNVSGNLKNQVTVSGSSIDGTGTNSSYTVQDSHANATLERNGYLDISKVDERSHPLSGAVFTLYSDQALQNPIRISSVRSDGTLRIVPIPAPQNSGDPEFTYYLKETTVPSGYESDNMVYTVTVKRGSDNKAVTTVSGKTPGAILTVMNYPINTVGKLSISKAVEGNAANTADVFDFTIEFTGSSVDSVYNYIGSGGKENGQLTISGNRGTFQLKDKESITITGLPDGVSYHISEADSGDGYLASSTGESGFIVAGQTRTVSFTNTKLLPGSLAIKKSVDGNAEENISFDFTVTFTKPDSTPDNGLYDYSGPNETGKISSGDKFSLAHNQSIIITGLPKDTVYTVTEDNYSDSGYTPSFDHATGAIDTDKEQTISFTNTKWLPGSLTVKKTVAGNAEENIKFDFTVTLTKPDGTPDNGEYSYSGTGGDGKISNGGHISLAHGQSITITGLPKDTVYTVTENNDPQNGYIMNSDHVTGNIITNDEQTASFINTKWLPGSLTVSKTVTGSGGDTKKKFDFTVTFTAAGSYSYTGNGVSEGTIRSGDKISLADGESITITGLPDGTEYQVTEADYTAQRYTTASTGDNGTIDTLTTSAAIFTNTYHKRSSSGGGGGGNSGGGPKVTTPNPTTPAEPGTPVTETPKPREEMTPQEVYDVYGEVPLGYMAGPDGKIHTPQELYDIWGQVPLGYMVGIDGQIVPLGLPKTGQGTGILSHYGLVLLIADFLVLCFALMVMRREEPEEK